MIVATDVDKFLILKAEGVAISVSRCLPFGYIELLDREVPNYLNVCDDTYQTCWDINIDTHRGKKADLNCHDSSYEWLSLMTMVNKSDPAAYTVRLVGFDMIPIFGEDFRDMLRQLRSIQTCYHRVLKFHLKNAILLLQSVELQGLNVPSINLLTLPKHQHRPSYLSLQSRLT